MALILRTSVTRKLTVPFFIILSLIMYSSCTSTKKVLYFSELKNDTLVSSNIAPESFIQNNDLLSITVTSLNPEASSIFNLTSMQSPSAPTNTNSGFLVNSDGNIQFPVIGNIKAAGHTKEQLRINITDALKNRKLLIDPIVSIRFINFKVTVLGEVGRPTVISVPSEKISLLEAIGLAGDITINGKKDNVLLIREENKKKITRRLDLNSDDFLTSEFYYLQTNDVVYVEPNKARVADAGRAQRALPVVLSVLSFVVILADRLIN